MGTMAAIFGYPPPAAYATGDCGNQVFLIFGLQNFMKFYKIL